MFLNFSVYDFLIEIFLNEVFELVDWNIAVFLFLSVALKRLC